MSEVYYTRVVSPNGQISFVESELLPTAPEIITSRPVLQTTRPVIQTTRPVQTTRSVQTTRPIVQESTPSRSLTFAPSGPTYRTKERVDFEERLTTRGDEIIEDVRTTSIRVPGTLSSKTPQRAPVREIIREEIIEIDDPLLLIEENNLVYDPISIRDEHKVAFYTEVFERNLFGIIVSDEEAGFSLIAGMGAKVFQENYPRLIHYLQIAKQNDRTYWGIGSPILQVSLADPIRGKLRYIVAEKNSQYFSVVILSN